MYRDLRAWTAIRRAVLDDRVPKRQIIRETGIHWKTLQKILQHEAPPAIKQRAAACPSVEAYRAAVDRITDADRLRPMDQRHTPVQIAALLRTEYGLAVSPDQVAQHLTPKSDPRRAVWDEVTACLRQALGADASDLLLANLSVDPALLSLRTVKHLRHALRANRALTATGRVTAFDSRSDSTWALTVLLGKERLGDVREAVDDAPALATLYRAVQTGGVRRRTRALVVLARQKGWSKRRIARILRLSLNTVDRYCRAYREGGAGRLFASQSRAATKRNDQAVREAVFEVLHAPPSAHDINRTTWKMDDLRAVLKLRGVDLSRETIRAIIKDAGYRWRKAREVLTSNDPEYHEKLARMTAILANLKPGERFFSIDEFGPFTVKMKGGRVLAGPGEVPSVPQFQASKGRLIVTTALELSTNQVTHFYSEEKNTGEMLKLLDRLLDQYASCEKLYLSWDAASWHDSHALHVRVEAINHGTYRPGQGTPKVEFVPLPSRAQFLNVIEAVFSGMARAIIHCSDYQSIDEAQRAIDRHFRERNEHFRLYPKRAGKKIWGKERVPSTFSAANNCKDPRWCQER